MEWKCYISIALFGIVSALLAYLVFKRHTKQVAVKGTPKEPLLTKKKSVAAACPAKLP